MCWWRIARLLLVRFHIGRSFGDPSSLGIIGADIASRTIASALLSLVQVEAVITAVKDKDLDGKFVEMDVSVAFPLSVTRRRYKGSRPWVYLVSRERARGASAR